jgi:gliding motility-associated lipoprotein GldH
MTKRVVVFICVVFAVMACSDNRLYEDYVDFEERFWAVTERPGFEFQIDDPKAKYSLYCNLRIAESYPYSDFNFQYTLTDSTGKELVKRLVVKDVFDRKSGKPFGESGLGDIYDHQVQLAEHSFTNPGKYKITLEQFMRTDSLEGVLAVGVRVEKSVKE